MSIDPTHLCDILYPGFRGYVEKAGFGDDADAHVFVDFRTMSIWAAIGDKRARLASRQEIEDGSYRQTVNGRMKGFAQSARE